jgi:hypothetical protein
LSFGCQARSSAALSACVRNASVANGSSVPPSPLNPRDFAGLRTSVNVPATPRVSVNALMPLGPPHTRRPVPKHVSGSSSLRRSGSRTATAPAPPATRVRVNRSRSAGVGQVELPRPLSNREIAEILFVTRKTVEYQLGGAFAKLGIRSRTELPAVLRV